MRVSLNVIGCGKLGRTLAHLWAAREVLTVQDVLNRSQASAHAAVSFVGGGRAVDAIAEMRAADIWMIATPDAEIHNACEVLAASGRLTSGAIVFHCSGALSSAELASAAACGALTASAHPAASFADPQRMLAQFSGCFCSIEGDPAACRSLDAAFTAIGGRVVRIDGASKLLYHAGAVFASNYLVALMESALQTCMASGIARETAVDLLKPLAQGSLDNAFRLGPEQALTGPIARGELDLVKKQHAAIAAWDPAVAALYRQLGLAAARLAGRTVQF